MGTVNLHIFLTTANKRDAGSKSGLELVYMWNTADEKRIKLDGGGSRARGIPPAPRARGRGRSGHYTGTVVNLIREIQRRPILDSDFRLVTLGSDAWLPSSIFIIGIGAEFQGGSRILVQNEQWPSHGWFSTNQHDAAGTAAKARLLSDGSITNA